MKTNCHLKKGDVCFCFINKGFPYLVGDGLRASTKYRERKREVQLIKKRDSIRSEFVGSRWPSKLTNRIANDLECKYDSSAWRKWLVCIINDRSHSKLTVFRLASIVYARQMLHKTTDNSLGVDDKRGLENGKDRQFSCFLNFFLCLLSKDF